MTPKPPSKPGRPAGTSDKGRETQTRLFKIATNLIAKNGVEATTMRAIATEAGVSPALLYRYYPSKRAVVLALHTNLSTDFAKSAAPMRPAKWSTRFCTALNLSLATLKPHRLTLTELIPTLIGNKEESLFSPATAESRAQVQTVFEQCVTGAKDAPKPQTAAALGRLLYFVHLAIIMLWLIDRSPKQRATTAIVALVPKALAPFGLALRIPAIARLVRNVDQALLPAFE